MTVLMVATNTTAVRSFQLLIAIELFITTVCFIYSLFLLRRGRGAEYFDQFVCLSVCLSVREHISGTAGQIFMKAFCANPLWPGLGPPLAALRYVVYFRFYA